MKAQEESTSGGMYLANLAKAVRDTPPEELAKRIEAEVSDPRQMAERLDSAAQLYKDFAVMNRETPDVFQDFLLKAELLYRRGLAVREQAFRPDAPEIAGSLGRLAILSFMMDKETEGELLVERLLAMTAVPNSAGPAWLLDELAYRYKKLGKLEKAGMLEARAKAIREKARAQP